MRQKFFFIVRTAHLRERLALYEPFLENEIAGPCPFLKESEQNGCYGFAEAERVALERGETAVEDRPEAEVGE